MQELTEYSDRIRFSGFSTKVICLLYAMYILVEAGLIVFNDGSMFVAASSESDGSFFFNSLFKLYAIYYLGLAALVTYLSFRIKFFELKGDQIQIADYFTEDWIDPRDVTEVRLLFYNLYLVRLSKPCRYGSKIIFARSIRDTFKSLFTKVSFENEKIHWLREFAAANQAALEQQRQNPEADSISTLSFNAVYYRLSSVFFGFFCAFGVLFAMGFIAFLAFKGHEAVWTGILGEDTFSETDFLLFLFYPFILIFVAIYGSFAYLGYVAINMVSVTATADRVQFKKLSGYVLDLSVENVLDIRYIYDWVYAIRYVDPMTGRARNAFFARSLLKSLGSLFSAGTIEYENLRDFRQRVLERRYFNGQLSGNPMMEFLPQPRVLERAEIETN